VTLVAEIAQKVGRSEVAARLRATGATVELALEQLRELLPLVLLIDDADKLATAGEGFSQRFFEVIRGYVEERKLTWVSASRGDLYEVFRDKGLMSEFLNSSTKLWVGPLDEDAARELVSRGAPEHGDRMLQEAGGFAYGLQWLGDRLLRSQEDLDEACDAFRLEMKGRVFSSWWSGLQPEERVLLKSCVRAGELSMDEGEEQRLRLKALKDRGFLVKDGRHFRLASGRAWQEFVRHAS
jgi:hypothetical protein